MNVGEGDAHEGEHSGEEGDEEEELEEVEVEKEIDDGEENKPLTPRLSLTKSQKEDIYEAFRLLDNIGNGLIDASKFRIVLYALGYEATPEELKAIIAKVGETPYGKLCLSDFAKLIMNKCVEKDCESDMIKSFMFFDTEKIGEIYPDHIKKVAKIIGDDSNDEEIMEMFQAADENDSGMINVFDFIRVMNHCVPLHIEKMYE